MIDKNKLIDAYERCRSQRSRMWSSVRWDIKENKPIKMKLFILLTPPLMWLFYASSAVFTAYVSLKN